MKPASSRRRPAFLGALAVAAALVLSAPASAAEALFHLTFQLDWRPNAQFAGLFVARDRGWFRDEGLEVELLPVDPEMKVVERVVAGGNWMGCSESGVLLNAVAEGAPIRALGTMLQGSPMALISLGGRGRTNFAALRGRTLGIHPDGRKAFELAIVHDGFRTSDFNIVEKEHDLTPLLNGRCDAVQGYLIDEVVELESAGRSADIIPLHEHGYAAYSQVYFTSEAFLRRHRDRVAAFLRAARRGWLAAALDPAAAAALVVQRHAPELDPEYQRRSLERVVELATLEGGLDGLGAMSLGTWKAALAAFESRGTLPGRVRLSRFVDPRIARAPAWSLGDLDASDAWRAPGGDYSPLPSAPKVRGSGRLWASVDGGGRPVRVLVATPTSDLSADRRAAAWVLERWRWPAGPAKKVCVPLPLPTESRQP